jgi:uncharacterized membrane-anchored protein YjiN (DUF445 family)
MSQPECESEIVNSFRELLDYVSTLGEQINQIYDHLERIELDVVKIKEDFGSSIAENKEGLESIKKNIITKSEFNNILQKLNQPFEKFIPPKAPDTRARIKPVLHRAQHQKRKKLQNSTN